MNDASQSDPLTALEQTVAKLAIRRMVEITAKAAADLRALQDSPDKDDRELTHLRADDILLDALIQLGCPDVAAAYNDIRDEVDFDY